jgi:hypothetical protein
MLFPRAPCEEDFRCDSNRQHLLNAKHSISELSLLSDLTHAVPHCQESSGASAFLQGWSERMLLHSRSQQFTGVWSKPHVTVFKLLRPGHHQHERD